MDQVLGGAHKGKFEDGRFALNTIATASSRRDRTVKGEEGKNTRRAPLLGRNHDSQSKTSKF